MGLLDFDSHYDEDVHIMQQADAQVKEIVTTQVTIHLRAGICRSLSLRGVKRRSNLCL